MKSSPLFLAVSFVCITYAAALPECNRRECAKYTVVEKKDNYEVRIYEEHKIATTKSKNLSFKRAKYSSFMPLFRYISKNNDRREKIEMTIPVLNGVKMQTKDGERKRTNDYEMSFFMPSKLTNPPTPSNDKIEIKTFGGAAKVYVISFGGYATEDRVLKKQDELKQMLVADNVPFDDTMFYIAGYNSPWQFKNRHNDLFYLGTDNE